MKSTEKEEILESFIVLPPTDPSPNVIHCDPNNNRKIDYSEFLKREGLETLEKE